VRKPLWWHAMLLFAALLLRLYRLNEGLWLDEIITYLKYARLSFGNHHHLRFGKPAFSLRLLAHASLLTFGDSAWALRLPAVLLG
jgi:hypothetical protein